jgi:hypothetical protein
MILRNKNLWFSLVTVASLWNIMLSILAILNSHWTLRRVAGGQLHTLPTTIRAYFFLLLLISIAEIWFANKLCNLGGPWSYRTARICTSLTIAYGLSTLVNLISKSPAERLNALFAIAVALGFYFLGKRELKA